MLALMLMLRCACSVRVWSARSITGLTAALTVMSPKPVVLASVEMVTSVVRKLVAKVVAPMLEVVCPPEPELMLKSTGSSNHCPDLPCPVAWVLTRMLSPTFSVWPEVSTWPPLPPSLALPAPLASMRPSTCVTPLALCTSLHNTTLPPSPLSVALASMLAPCAIVTCTAWRVSPWPCQSPPTSTVPPP